MLRLPMRSTRTDTLLTNTTHFRSQADGGSISIDHVECIPLETQAKLVEFLNSGAVQMIGGSIRQSVDVRIIATSTSPLDKLIAAGHFREDLFYALSRAPFTLPSPSERRGAVRPLARHLPARLGRATRREQRRENVWEYGQRSGAA